MMKSSEKVIWKECISDRICIKVFGKNQCADVEACVSVIQNDNSYLLEVEAFGERWRWNLSQACWTFYEVGILSLTLCAEPIENGANVTLEGCVSVAGIKKCVVLLKRSITWFSLDSLKSEDLTVFDIRSQLREFERGALASISVDLDQEEVSRVRSITK